MLNNILKNEFFWSLITLILSIAAHFFRKRLLRNYNEEKNRIKEIEEQNQNTNLNYRKNHNENILKAQINVLDYGKWVILLMALFVFLRAIGIVPPAEEF